MTLYTRFFVLCALSGAFAACSDTGGDSEGGDAALDVVEETDGETTGPDADDTGNPSDTETDASEDIDEDVAADAADDAESDAELDVAEDIEGDTLTDTGADAAADTAPDAAPDVADAAADTDTSTDAGTDTGIDAATDTDPVVPTGLECPDDIAEALVACAESAADPDVTIIDEMLACAEADALEDEYDTYCSIVPAAPICGIGFDAFTESVLSECVEFALGEVFEGTCVLPDTYRELRFSPYLVVIEEGIVDGGSVIEPGSVLEQQLLSVASISDDTIETAADAIADTDDDLFVTMRLLDVSTRRIFFVVSATYGDNRFGRIFLDDSTIVVGDIIDGDIGECRAEAWLVGSPCETSVECPEEGIFCIGAVDAFDGGERAPGRCLGGETGRPTDGSVCTTDTDCSLEDGLACASFGFGDGECSDAWLRRRFGYQSQALEGSPTVIPLMVSGVATVALHATVSLVVSHPRPADLRISIALPGYPDSSVGVIFEDRDFSGSEIVLDEVRAPFPSDESINGEWSLVIEDLGTPVAGERAGQVFNIEIYVESWFD